MTREPADSPDSADRLGAVLVACIEAVDQGDADAGMVIARHPEYAAELGEFFAAQERAERLAAPLQCMLHPAPTVDTTDAAFAPPNPVGDFRLLREVGRGGMGIVYEAEQVSLGRRVALKVLPFAATMDPRQLQRFQNEARAAAGLHHTNIVPVHFVGCERGLHYYAMQFIEGRDLASMLTQLRTQAGNKGIEPGTAQTGLVPAGQPTAAAAAATPPIAGLSTQVSAKSHEYFQSVARLGIQAAEALDYAHQMGIVHRDVKSANMLVDSTGRLWVTDFGLAQIQSDARLTLSGELVGTLRYMSPEQALAKRMVIDHRTDVYSLGATLYELLTLQPVFEGSDRQELLRQIAFEEPRPPRRVNKAIPAELEIIVLKALEKNPLERYATAKELSDDLERYLRDESIQARRPSLARRVSKWARRHQPAVWAAAFAAFLACATGLWYQQDRAERREEATRREADQRAELAQREAERRAESARREAEERLGAKEALAEAQALARQARWPQARAILAQALAQLGQAAPAELRQSLELAQCDLDLVALLDSIRLKKAVIVDNKLYWEKAEADYATAFRDAGLLRNETEPATLVVSRVQASAVRPALVAALDDWAGIARDRKRRAWLLEVARLADPDPVRDRVRDPALWDDAKSLVKWAGEVDAKALGAQLLAALGDRLVAMGEDPVPLLKAAQTRYPSDFWLNYDLATRLNKVNKNYAEAIAYYRAANALRPDASAVYNGLGIALFDQGRHEEAVAALQRACQLEPNNALDHINIGAMLIKLGRPDEAVAELRAAVKLKPDSAEAFYNLGMALRQQGNKADAAKAWQRAIELKPDYAKAYWDLGLNLRYHQGRFAESLAALKRAQELGSRQPDWPASSAAEIRQAELLVELDAKLPTILQGRVQPRDPAERLTLAEICQRYKSLYAAAVCFYTDAFAQQPNLADDMQGGHRYNAACAAALAGCGRGKDADQSDDNERVRLRRQALDWLRADLNAWRSALEKDKLKAAPVVGQKMQHWLGDTDFSGVRGAEALAKLPAAERQAWQKLWTDAADTLARAKGTVASEKKSTTK